MPILTSHPGGVLRDHALSLMLAERGEAVVLVAEGDRSMVPHLRGGDAVLAVSLASPPRSGDLLLYRQQDYWVVHRCLGRAHARDGRSGLRTRGDGRNLLDPQLALEDVRARVIALRRGGVWRSLEGPAAQAYARIMAGHDLVWSALGIAARKTGIGRVVEAVDLGLLRLAVPLIFPLIHSRIAAPASSSPDETV